MFEMHNCCCFPSSFQLEFCEFWAKNLGQLLFLVGGSHSIPNIFFVASLPISLILQNLCNHSLCFFPRNSCSFLQLSIDMAPISCSTLYAKRCRRACSSCSRAPMIWNQNQSKQERTENNKNELGLSRLKGKGRTIHTNKWS